MTSADPLHHDVGILQVILSDHKCAYRPLQSVVQLDDRPDIAQAPDIAVQVRAKSVTRERAVHARARPNQRQLFTDRVFSYVVHPACEDGSPRFGAMCRSHASTRWPGATWFTCGLKLAPRS